ncbi:hypothetical protein [Methylobacter sp. YRD-M1]|uniref:hypothetical protein n=1 Tax=Methylobacter sp. YRD-M1 TaxID=2911520 RepID=UPI00227D3FE0|nr:hypothetical protein [Methylobacter sp. YRD-M1]WAK03371.1 hypothetical protein LZ558_06215 [Methylobacter sp. YRD-M1]
MTMQYFIIVALTCITIFASSQASELPKDKKQNQKIQQKDFTAETLAQNPQLETYFSEGQCQSCHSTKQIRGFFAETERKQ